MTIGTISYSSTTIPFLVANMPAGFMDAVAVAQAEELTTPGIDGRRWRTLFSQFPSFQLVTISECATYDAACTLKGQAERLVQRQVTLQLTLAGAGYTMRQVHVSAVQAKLFPGALYGAGAGSGLAHAELTWQLEATDFNAST